MLVPTGREAHRQSRWSLEGRADQRGGHCSDPLQCSATVHVRESTLVGWLFCDDHTVSPWDKVNRGERPDSAGMRSTLSSTPVNLGRPFLFPGAPTISVPG